MKMGMIVNNIKIVENIKYINIFVVLLLDNDIKNSGFTCAEQIVNTWGITHDLVALNILSSNYVY